MRFAHGKRNGGNNRIRKVDPSGTVRNQGRRPAIASDDISPVTTQAGHPKAAFEYSPDFRYKVDDREVRQR